MSCFQVADYASTDQSVSAGIERDRRAHISLQCRTDCRIQRFGTKNGSNGTGQRFEIELLREEQRIPKLLLYPVSWAG
jgi:hypothetical protein